MSYESLYDELSGWSESGWIDLEGLMTSLPCPATFTQSTDKEAKSELGDLVKELIHHIEEVEYLMGSVSDTGTGLINQLGDD